MIISISITVLLPFCPSFQFFLHGMLMHQSHNNSARNMIHLHCTCECVYKRQRTSGLSWDKRQESVVRSIWKSLLTTSVRASRVSRSLSIRYMYNSCVINKGNYLYFRIHSISLHGSRAWFIVLPLILVHGFQYCQLYRVSLQ